MFYLDKLLIAKMKIAVFGATGNNSLTIFLFKQPKIYFVKFIKETQV
jgi:hypothetical protein